MSSEQQSARARAVVISPSNAALSSRKAAEESKEQLSQPDNAANADDSAVPLAATSAVGSVATSPRALAVKVEEADVHGEQAVASPSSAAQAPTTPSSSSATKSATVTRRPTSSKASSAAPNKAVPAKAGKDKDTKAPKAGKKAAAASTTSTGSALSSPRQSARSPTKPSTPTISIARPALTVSPSQPATARRASVQASPLSSPARVRTVEETLGYWGAPPPGAPLLISLCHENRLDAVLDLLQATPLHERWRLVNGYDAVGNSALFYSLQPTHSALLSLLLDYGADVNHVNDKRNAALHLAVHFSLRRAMSGLIDCGANIRLENWEHQQPHAILKSPDRIAQAQQWLNSAYDAYQEKVRSGQVTTLEPQLRAYYRGLFDVADRDRLGVLTWAAVEGVVRTALREREERREREAPKVVVRMTAAERAKEREKDAQRDAAPVVGVDWVLEWFRAIDVDHNGVLSFAEFLNAVVALKAEQERDDKKATRKKKTK